MKKLKKGLLKNGQSCYNVIDRTVRKGYHMNDSFFNLPEEKRTALINAALRVFSQHGYRKSPMNEIAAEAGISKSLLFHYFHNKKELYLYLWDKCADITIEYLTRYNAYGHDDLVYIECDGLSLNRHR